LMRSTQERLMLDIQRGRSGAGLDLEQSIRPLLGRKIGQGDRFSKEHHRGTGVFPFDMRRRKLLKIWDWICGKMTRSFLRWSTTWSDRRMSFSLYVMLRTAEIPLDPLPIITHISLDTNCQKAQTQQQNPEQRKTFASNVPILYCAQNHKLPIQNKSTICQGDSYKNFQFL
jgi:hypothetical protein